MCTLLSPANRHPGRRQTGISLIELIMFMVIVSIGLAGILSVMNVTARGSSDPMLRKQALAIAESLLEEIELQPFTWCDPDDPAAATATGTGSCAIVENFGPEPGETRYSTTQPFDNVNDYGILGGGTNTNFMPNGILDLNGTPIPLLGQYNATVTISQVAVGGVTPTDSLRIDVNVKSGNNVDLTLTGYRLRYAPNVTP